jgi:hypothetical protein
MIRHSRETSERPSLPDGKTTSRFARHAARPLGRAGSKILFPSARGGPLSSDSVQYLVTKYAATARKNCPSLSQKRVTAARVSTPNIAQQLYKSYKGLPNRLAELPDQAATFLAGTMGGAGESEAPMTPARGLEAPAAEPSANSPVSRPPLVQQVRSLPQGQYEAPASPLPPQGQLGEGVYEGEYMEEPPPVIRGQLPRGPIPQPGGFEPNQPALPARGQPIRLPAEFPPARQPIIRTTNTAPARLVDQIMERASADEPYPRLIDQIKAKASPEISRPVTENPVVGSLVRAMQKSGLPIAERPNLLLKGSGRVNRILGPEENLAGPLEKSVRQAKRQKSANAGPLSRLR